MNVLSLFDGMSCGQIALERLGIKVDKYYASEIDEPALMVSKKNYPNTIYVGDVAKIKADDLEPIDLLIGGSPCQGFSFNGKQLAFDDERSVLFFEFVRLLKEYKPKYFLLENVNMKKEYEDVINKFLGCRPIKINSKIVSAQSRPRLYWTNIPLIGELADKNILLKDVLETDKPKEYFDVFKAQDRKIKSIENKKWSAEKLNDINGKCQCLTAGFGMGGSKPWIYCDYIDYIRMLTPVECERLQNVPDDYTKCDGITNRKRYKMLGNGWTVDVIAHILKNIEQGLDI